MTGTGHIEKAYLLAKESYAALGVDTEGKTVPILSLAAFLRT